MNELFVIMPGDISPQLIDMVNVSTKGRKTNIIKSKNNLPDLSFKKILFVVELNKMGFSIEMIELLNKLYERGSDSLYGSTGALLVHSPNEYGTKSAARDIVFAANQLGCSFIGHPLVEATNNLKNFTTWQKALNLTLEEICLEQSSKLVKRLMEDNIVKISRPNIVVLHASSRSTSNTLMLWHLIEKELVNCTVKELHVENGTIKDCIGCSFKTCLHYSQQFSCFYGGFMIEEVFPAIESADAVIWVCPNYNDSISANLSAVINRLTALYRKISFYDKFIYSVIVSGNSGSDSVARQLTGALNINKGFRLPPHFSIMETANSPGEILNICDIDAKAYKFAMNINSQLTGTIKGIH